jgi:hypothetical protein
LVEEVGAVDSRVPGVAGIWRELVHSSKRRQVADPTGFARAVRAVHNGGMKIITGTGV